MPGRATAGSSRTVGWMTLSDTESASLAGRESELEVVTFAAITAAPAFFIVSGTSKVRSPCGAMVPSAQGSRPLRQGSRDTGVTRSVG